MARRGPLLRKCGESRAGPALQRRTRPVSTPDARAIIEFLMKARVFVSLKSTVLDPQGQTICSALHGLGYPAIADVRQGKFFDIVIGEGKSPDLVLKDIETIAQEVLVNPVIEDYRVEILG